MRHVRFIPDGGTVIVQDVESSFLMRLRTPIEANVPTEDVSFLPIRTDED
jgi:hypothetical protein